MNTYTKLKSGEWGIRVQGSARVGERVTVTKKSGESKMETIGKVIWSGNGVTICAIANMRVCKVTHKKAYVDRYGLTAAERENLDSEFYDTD